MLNKDNRVKRLPIVYRVASSSLRKHGVFMDKDTIAERVQLISKAEAVPPWQKSQWDVILNAYVPSRVHYSAEKKRCETDAPVLRSSEPVRFLFTHQMYGQDHLDQSYAELADLIQTRIHKSDYESITNRYQQNHDEWVHSYPIACHHPDLKDDFEKARLLSQDFSAALRHVSDLGNIVSVEKIYSSMESLVVVCSVDKNLLSTATNKAMAWVRVLSNAFAVRKAFDMKAKKLGVVPNCNVT
jgi:hypothetical protein